MKGRSSRLLRQEFPWLKSRLPTLWTNSYFVSTELRACYPVEVEAEASQGSVAGVDLGEIHLAVTHDGVNTDIFNGRYLRSVRRYLSQTQS